MWAWPTCRKTTKKNYYPILLEVRELVPEFQPSEVIADFAEAATTAVREVFGNRFWLLVSITPRL